jgi:hypothetical protein
VLGTLVKDAKHHDSLEIFTPVSAPEVEAVRGELERILSSSLFGHSKRYPALLRYVVEQSLNGNHDLKERTLGIDVFGRTATYDSNLDPVVRVTAGEVRKRLAQFYRSAPYPTTYEIDLPSGGYAPIFLRHSAEPVDAAVAIPEAVLLPRPEPIPSAPKSRERKSMRGWWALALVAVILISAGWAFNGVFRAAKVDVVRQFWSSMIDSADTPILCLGDVETFQQFYATLHKTADGGQSEPQPSGHRNLTTRVADVLMMGKLSKLLHRYGKDLNVTSSLTASLSDLRSGPVVLIGAHNNRWTMRLTDNLRFYSVMDATGSHIYDRNNPLEKTWFHQLNASSPDDYGILARYYDPTLGRPVIIIAGLTAQGNAALVELVSEPKLLGDLLKGAPQNWSEKNLEAVVRVPVIEDKNGPPSVVAFHYW